MGLRNLNNILKLKMHKIYFIKNLSQKKSHLTLNFIFLNYIIYLNLTLKNSKLIINLFNNLNVSNLMLNKYSSFNFFNNINLNLLFIYNILNSSSLSKSRLLNNNKISNYNFKYLFIYYFFFVQNIKSGLSKYFSNSYQNNFFFLKFFILKFINNFIRDKEVFLKFNRSNLLILSDKSFYFSLFKKVRYLRFLNDINLKSKAFLNLLLIFLYNKDTVLFKNAIKNILENLHFKTHRKFLYNLKIIFKSLATIFYSRFKCTGLFIRVKGKIGVGGNSKKRKFTYKLGSFSFTKKNQKLSYSKDSIRTYSGVLGIEIYLTYK